MVIKKFIPTYTVQLSVHAYVLAMMLKKDINSNNNFPPIGYLNYYFNGFLYDEATKKAANQGELVLLGPKRVGKRIFRKSR